MSLDTNSKAAGSSWTETAKIVIQALAIAMVVRVFFYQPFNIPSGSMKSTLLIGDYLFVSKLSYGY
ncbi:MAG TPA: S26 family signal peptidase, partial [Hyphomicrobium sp.]|nr:S26 family signal peptidase [Hyphomicrobium sp.]